MKKSKQEKLAEARADAADLHGKVVAVCEEINRVSAEVLVRLRKRKLETRSHIRIVKVK